MRAAVFHGAGDIRLCDVPDPSPREGEVVVKVERAGICGSDVNRFRWGSHPWAPGFIMGHEFCGEIADVGPGVSGWRAGDSVIVQPTLSCGACFYCRAGHENRCVEFLRRGLTGSGTDGGFAAYVRVPAYQPHPRPAELPPDVATLVEPAAVSVHGWRLAGIDRPDGVVVIGIGNIGLLAVLAAQALGAARVVAVGKYAADRRWRERMAPRSCSSPTIRSSASESSSAPMASAPSWSSRPLARRRASARR